MLIRGRPSVVVMGVAGSGKSTVGAALAQRLAVPFADADDFHSEQAKAKMAAGHPLDDADRAPWLERLASWLHDEPLGCVLACSGLRRWYRDALRTGAPGLCFLHLVGDPSVMTGRVAGRQQHYMPASLVHSQYETLEPLGPDEFGVAIDCTLTPEQIVEQFLREVR